jgi:hypothetical protein
MQEVNEVTVIAETQKNKKVRTLRLNTNSKLTDASKSGF